MKFEYSISQLNFNATGEASSNIKKTLKLLGVDSKIIRKIAIAAYEAEMNIAIHSNGGGLTLLVEENQLKLIAEDTGPGIADINSAMKEGFSTAGSEIREMGFGAGMGLPNIRNCSDHFEIRSELGSYTYLAITVNLTGEKND